MVLRFSVLLFTVLKLNLIIKLKIRFEKILILLTLKGYANLSEGFIESNKTSVSVDVTLNLILEETLSVQLLNLNLVERV
jgi:hypothetical protein